MEKTKIVYFEGVRGRAESLCMLFEAAGVEYEDIRVSGEDWIKGSAKKESPYGQLPYVIYNGKKIGQSVAIATYFAKKFGFYGNTEEDALREEEVLHLAEDFTVPSFRTWVVEKDPTAKAGLAEKMKTELFPRYLSYFEALLKENGDGGFFVGDSVTVADMSLYNILTTVLGIDPQALAPFPLLAALRTNVGTCPPLKEFLASRPKTDV